MSTEHFGDRLIGALRRVRTPLCVGLDPHLAQLPRELGADEAQPTSDATVRAVSEFLHFVVDACRGQVAAVKPQIAFFEQLGWRGLKLLEELCVHVKQQGLLVVLDAKRGDIGSTGDAYARAYLSPYGPFAADALTVNPYMGLDTLLPFLRVADGAGAGLFVLAKTSNPGSGDFEDQRIGELRLFEHVASSLRQLADERVGSLGWSSLGIVAGAPYPNDSKSLRALLPRSLFLIPGFGAQGGSAEDAVATFQPGPGGLEGGLVNSSRAILFGELRPGEDWRGGLRRRLQNACQELAGAVEI